MTQVASDDFLVLWQDDASGSYDLHGAYVTAGAVITSELAVQSGDSDQLSPALVYDAPIKRICWPGRTRASRPVSMLDAGICHRPNSAPHR